MLAKDGGDLWDTGKVESDRSVHVEYARRALMSRMWCYWKVRVWDDRGQCSAWSAPAFWTMRLLKPADWGKAQWIGWDRGYHRKSGEHTRLAARYLRREFAVNGTVKYAAVYVCGLGEFELSLNGRKLGDRERDPGNTLFSRRVLYVTFDVTLILRQGVNALGVILGNGRYFTPRATVMFGYPKMILHLRIEYENGSVQDLISDGRWKITDRGPIRANNECDGERYDARMEMPGWERPDFDDSKWQKVQRVKEPGGRLQARMFEPMRITEVLKPVAITNPKPGVCIVDMGQGFYGTVRLKVSGPAGTRVQMRSSFSLLRDGRLNVLNNRSARTTDVYIMSGRGQEHWRPHFRGQGYRYDEVTGFLGRPTAKNFQGLVMHDNVE